MELSESELKELKEVLSKINTTIPHDKTGYIWSTFNLLRKENEPQPCLCKSSVGNWVRAVNFLREYVSDK